MNINSTTLYHPISYVKTNVESNQGNSSYTQKSLDMEQDLSLKQNDSLNIWKELSSDYDVKNATFDEICEISNELYEAGEISLREHATLTFDWKRTAEHARQNLQIPVKDFNLTLANSEGKRNWIAEYEARGQRDLKFNNLLGYQSNQTALSVLKRLDVQ